jgi:hypothetical protein
MKQVKLHPKVDEMLTKLSETRKESGNAASSKQSIVAELITSAHKREVK